MHMDSMEQAGSSKKHWLKLIGRILLGLVFLTAGWSKLTGFAGLVGMLGQVGFPLPTLFAVLAVVFEFGGAILLITGFHARTAAWALIVFTVIATAVFHDPSNPQQLMMFEKNLAIIGGLLYVAVAGAGRYGFSRHNAMCPMCKNGICPDAVEQH
jgi:putative oxidoreductase